jgi:S-ribosylhomocysteine lyase LuxS involved in autoinducer biosynthesis
LTFKENIPIIAEKNSGNYRKNSFKENIPIIAEKNSGNYRKNSG